MVGLPLMRPRFFVGEVLAGTSIVFFAQIGACASVDHRESPVSSLRFDRERIVISDAELRGESEDDCWNRSLDPFETKAARQFPRAASRTTRGRRANDDFHS